MKSAGIRELKTNLSRYVDEVRRGEVVLVTDRGQVVAELRQPAFGQELASVAERRLAPLVARGELTLGDRSRRRPPPPGPHVELSAEAVDNLINDLRSDP